MDETDAFFTHTIVGAPLSVVMGRRQAATQVKAMGLSVDPNSGESRLSQVWRDWVILSHACDPVGQPRMRPSKGRAWLERHALWLAALGLLSLLVSLLTWGVVAWS